MYDDRPKPAFDPAENCWPTSTYVATEFLLTRLRCGSMEAFVRRLGEHKELLLFNDQLDDLKNGFGESSITWKTFLALVSARIVFYVVEPVPEPVDRVLLQWRSLQNDARKRPGEKWGMVALLRELNDKQKLVLARVTCAKTKSLLTDDTIERAFANYVGITCG